MSQQNKTQLQSSINSQINDNNTGEISAADIRDNLINITDSLLFNSGSQSFAGSLQVTGSVAISSSLLVSGGSSFDGSAGKEVIIGPATAANYFLLSAGQLFVRSNNVNTSSNTGLALQSGNSNNYDAQIFINGNSVSTTSTIQFKTSNNGSLTTRAEINNTGMSINSPTSITGSLSIKGSDITSNITIVSASYTYGSSDEAVSIRTTSATNIPSFLLGTNGTKTFKISSYNGNDASLYTTDLTSLSLDCDNGNVNLQPNTLGNTVSHGNFLVVSGSSLIVTGSSTLGGNLTVTGNTLLGNQLTDTTGISGSFTVVSNTNSTDRALTIINATTSQTSGSVDITSTSNTAMPSVFLRTRNNSSNLMIAGTSNDTEIRFTGGELGITTLDGNITLDPSSYGIILSGLPITEPTTSGQLWVSGSAGSNSKVLCVRN